MGFINPPPWQREFINPPPWRTGFDGGLPTEDIEEAYGSRLPEPPRGQGGLSGRIDRLAGGIGRAIIGQPLEALATMNTPELLYSKVAGKPSPVADWARRFRQGASEEIEDEIRDPLTGLVTKDVAALTGSLVPIAPGLGRVARETDAARKATQPIIQAVADPIERRFNTGLRGQIDEIIPTLYGKSDDELRSMIDSPTIDEATERAIERVMARRHSARNPSVLHAEDQALPIESQGPGGLGSISTRGLTPEETAVPKAELRPPLKPPEIPFQFNASRLDLPEEEASDVARIVNDNIDAIQRQRRGTQTWDQTEELAGKLGMTVEDFQKTRPGQTLNAEEHWALGSAIGTLGRKIHALNKAIRSGDQSAVEPLSAASSQYIALIRVAGGAGSEAGRALNVLRANMAAGLSDVDAAKVQLAKRFADTMDSELSKRLAMLDPENPHELHAFLRSAARSTTGDKLQQIWYNSILSGPATQERNFVGNLTLAASELPVRVVRPTIDVVKSAVTGKPREHFFSEIVPSVAGMRAGLSKGIEKGMFILRNGYGPDTSDIGKFDLGAKSIGAMESSKSKAVRGFGKAISIPTRVLGAVDSFFSAVNETSEMYAQAAKKAAKETSNHADFVEKMAFYRQNPTDEMLAAAKKVSQKLTLKDPVSPFAQWTMKGREIVPGARFVAPFVRVADRLMARGFEFTPLSPKLWKAAVNKLPPGETLTDLTARAAIGSTIMAGIAQYAADGNVTAWAPRDAAERDQFYAMGKKPWSVRIGDRWVPFNQLEPYATPLALVASTVQGVREANKEPTDLLDKIAAGAYGIASYVSDKSYMEGFQRIFQGMRSWQDAGKNVGQFAVDTAKGFIPYSAALRAGAFARDPTVKEPSGLAERAMTGVPFADERLPRKLDAFGKPITPTGGRLRGLVAQDLMPEKAKDDDPIRKELDRVGYGVGFVTPKMSVKGEEVTLTPDQRRQYQEAAGEETQKRLAALFGSLRYQRAPLEKQRDMIKDARTRARKLAKTRLQRTTWRAVEFDDEEE